MGVPLWSVIYALVKRTIGHKLKNKGLPAETQEYLNVDKIKDKEFIMLDPDTSKRSKKKIKQINKVTLANQQLKSTVKNAIKETDKAVAAGNKERAEDRLKLAIKSLDNAKVKGLVHKNKVDREKSRLTKKVNTMEVK